MRVCQHFLNLSYIERMAAALFLSLSARMSSPTVTGDLHRHFHKDEIRHAQAMARLQDYFDVHHYQTYTPSRAMLAFIPYFTGTLDSMNPAFANNAVTIGELFLDIALAARAQRLRGRSAQPCRDREGEPGRVAPRDDGLLHDGVLRRPHHEARRSPPRRPARVQSGPLGTTIWGQGFAYDVFIAPMQYLDAQHTRQKEALVRIRRLFDKPEVAKNPAVSSANSPDRGDRITAGPPGRRDLPRRLQPR